MIQIRKQLKWNILTKTVSRREKVFYIFIVIEIIRFVIFIETHYLTLVYD